MGLIDKFKSLVKPEGYTDKDGRYYGNIYKELGMIEPFTLLVGEQFRSFISNLSKNKLLNETERKALDALWYAACVDIDGYGNNIWNLKTGSFVVYDNDDVAVRFEKKKSELEDEYGEGRANFVYLSKDGNFIINQSDRNKKAFLVYVSENVADRLLQAMREAECKSLEIKKINKTEKRNVGIPAMAYTPLLDKNIKVPTFQPKQPKHDTTTKKDPYAIDDSYFDIDESIFSNDGVNSEYGDNDNLENNIGGETLGGKRR